MSSSSRSAVARSRSHSQLSSEASPSALSPSQGRADYQCSANYPGSYASGSDVKGKGGVASASTSILGNSFLSYVLAGLAGEESKECEVDCEPVSWVWKGVERGEGEEGEGRVPKEECAEQQGGREEVSVFSWFTGTSTSASASATASPSSAPGAASASASPVADATTPLPSPSSLPSPSTSSPPSSPTHRRRTAVSSTESLCTSPGLLSAAFSPSSSKTTSPGLLSSLPSSSFSSQLSSPGLLSAFSSSSSSSSSSPRCTPSKARDDTTLLASVLSQLAKIDPIPVRKFLTAAAAAPAKKAIQGDGWDIRGEEGELIGVPADFFGAPSELFGLSSKKKED